MLPDDPPAHRGPGVEELAEAPGVPGNEIVVAVVVGDGTGRGEDEGVSGRTCGDRTVLDEAGRLEAAGGVVPRDGREAGRGDHEAADPLGVGRRNLGEGRGGAPDAAAVPVAGGIDLHAARDGPDDAGALPARIEDGILNGGNAAEDEPPLTFVEGPPLLHDAVVRVHDVEQRVQRRPVRRGEGQLGVVRPEAQARRRRDRRHRHTRDAEVAALERNTPATARTLHRAQRAVAAALRLLPEDAGGARVPGGTVPKLGRGLGGVQDEHRALPCRGINGLQRASHGRGAEREEAHEGQNDLVHASLHSIISTGGHTSGEYSPVNPCQINPFVVHHRTSPESTTCLFFP